MALWKIQKLKKEQELTKKWAKSKWGNIEDKMEKIKLLQIQNKKDVQQEKDKKNGGWRPPVVTDSILQELKTCFAVGMTDAESCYFCKISERALYDYQTKHPEFLQEKTILKKSISLQAKVNIAKAIKSNSVQDSWKWLEKKDPDFRDKVEIYEPETEISEEDKAMYDRIKKFNLKK